MQAKKDEDLDGKFSTMGECNLVTYSELIQSSQSLPQDKPRLLSEHRMVRESWSHPSLSLMNLQTRPCMDEDCDSGFEIAEVLAFLDGLNVLTEVEKMRATIHLMKENILRRCFSFVWTCGNRVAWLDEFFKEKISDRLKSRGLVWHSPNKASIEMEGGIFPGISNGSQVNSQVLLTFPKSFGQVLNILDQSRLLLNEINQNHESRIPNNVEQNIGLISELRNNIGRVADLYGHLFGSCAKTREASSEGKSGGTLKSGGKSGQKSV